MIGRNINVGDDFVGVPKYASDIGCSIFQIFLGPPQQSFYAPRSIADLKRFGTELEKNNMKVVIHGNYTINLAHSIESVRGKASVALLARELTASQYMGLNCIGVVVHVGKNVARNDIPTDTAVKHFIENINTVLSKTPKSTTLIIETGSSRGSEICASIEDMGMVYNAVTTKERVMFCVDVCHVWATGYDVGSSSGAIDYFDTFDKIIGINKIACIHFNNSYDECGSKKDHHHDIEHGKIGIGGMKEVARIALVNNISLIMETPLVSLRKDGSKITFVDELALIKSWRQ